MHGQLPRNLEEKLVDIEQSYRWLKSGDIKGETESTIVAAQDQAISTNYFKNKICKALGIETTDKWCTHMPKPVCEEGDVTVLWNQAVHTDREVTANRPDIIIKNKKEKTCTL